MPCNSISAVTRVCGTSNIPGTEKMWMVAFKDLAPVSGDAVYVLSGTSSMVTQIGATGTYVEIAALRDTAGFDSEFTKDVTRGVAFATNTISFKLGDLTVEHQEFVETILNQPVSVLLKLRNGKYYVMGLTGQLEVSAIQATSGRTSADELSYTITLNEIVGITPYIVDPSIIATITA